LHQYKGSILESTFNCNCYTKLFNQRLACSQMVILSTHNIVFSEAHWDKSVLLSITLHLMTYCAHDQLWHANDSQKTNTHIHIINIKYTKLPRVPNCKPSMTNHGNYSTLHQLQNKYCDYLRQ